MSFFSVLIALSCGVNIFSRTNFLGTDHYFYPGGGRLGVVLFLGFADDVFF